MKFILFLVFINVLPCTLTAQTYSIFQSIADLRKSAAVKDGSVSYVLGYRSKGDGGGGVYVYSDTSKATDDGGAIIKSQGLAGAWIHEVQNKVVSLKWWGIRPLSATGTSYNLEQDDIYQSFNAAIHFIQTKAVGATLVIDAGAGGVWNNGTYYSSQTWKIDQPGIFITGTRSPIGRPSTRITWPAQDTCIYVPEVAKNVTLEHLEITQINNGFNWGDSTGHGIYSRAQIFADNLSFLNLAGDGIHIHACAIPNDPNYGNADHSVLKNIWANYTNNGLYLKGCDANKITIEKLQASNIRRWGVWDDSFLGNDYKEPHFAYCGFAGNNNPTTVQYKGKAYITRYQVVDKFINKGYEPDKHPEIWFQYWTSGYAPEWEPTKRYWSAGTFALINDNAVHNMVGNYTEDGQAPGFLNTRSSLLDGTRGTQTYGGSQKRVMFGTQYQNANHVFPGILVGQFTGQYEFPNVPVHAVQDGSKSGTLDAARFEALTDALWVNFKNTKGDAYINVNAGGDINLYPVKGSGLGVGSNSVHPVKPNIVSLGTAANRWSGLFVTNSGDDASSGTAILTQGRAVIKTKSVTSASKIFLTVSQVKGEQGFLSPSTIIDGASFIIESSSKTESSSVNWFILN